MCLPILYIFTAALQFVIIQTKRVISKFNAAIRDFITGHGESVLLCFRSIEPYLSLERDVVIVISMSVQTSMCSTTGPLSTNIVKRKMTVLLLLLLMVKSMAMMIKMMTMVIISGVYFEYFLSDDICIHANVVRCKLLSDVIKCAKHGFKKLHVKLWC